MQMALGRPSPLVYLHLAHRVALEAVEDPLSVDSTMQRLNVLTRQTPKGWAALSLGHLPALAVAFSELVQSLGVNWWPSTRTRLPVLDPMSGDLMVMSPRFRPQVLMENSSFGRSLLLLVWLLSLLVFIWGDGLLVERINFPNSIWYNSITVANENFIKRLSAGKYWFLVHNGLLDSSRCLGITQILTVKLLSLPWA
jgi:hypothetical protein